MSEREREKKKEENNKEIWKLLKFEVNKKLWKQQKSRKILPPTHQSIPAIKKGIKQKTNKIMYERRKEKKERISKEKEK